MRRSLFLLSLVVTFVVMNALVMPAAQAAEEPLNYVLVLVDDLGWMDLSCQGSTFYETPNIDRLAEQGMRFTNAYAACAVCSPTRAAVQTGRYPARLYVTDWIRSRFQGGTIPEDKINPCNTPKSEWKGVAVNCPRNARWMESEEVTIAEALRPAGYKSCYIGKWHLGTDPWYPTEQGYDENHGGCDYGQPPNYFDPFNQPNGKHEMLRDGIPTLPGRKKGQYLSDREAEEAVSFIERHKDQPFFLMLANYAVHTPIQAKKNVTEKYQTKTTGLQKNAKYAAMVESVDDAVGAITKTLEELGLEERTVIIFTSDNGGLKGPTDNTPLRSGKGYAYEGGIRVPFIVKWPGVVEPKTTCSVPVTSVDIFPTIVDSVEKAVAGEQAIDGLDLKPLLTGSSDLDRSAIYWHFPHYRHPPGPYSIIRDGDWKLIKWYHGQEELYDLANDLGEKKDLSSEQPERVAELETKLMKHLESVNAKVPFKPMAVAN